MYFVFLWTTDVCRCNLDIRRPTYTNLNWLQLETISYLAASLRCDGGLNGGIIEFQTNSVVVVHLVHCSYTLIISAEKAYHKQLSVVEAVMSPFEADLKMVKAHPHHGRSMTCCPGWVPHVPLEAFLCLEPHKRATWSPQTAQTHGRLVCGI